MIERLRELLAKATPGPWVCYIRPTGYTIASFECLITNVQRDPVVLQETWDRQTADAQLITETINSLPDLLNQLETLMARAEKAEAESEQWRKSYSETARMTFVLLEDAKRDVARLGAKVDQLERQLQREREITEEVRGSM